VTIAVTKNVMTARIDGSWNEPKPQEAAHEISPMPEGVTPEVLVDGPDDPKIQLQDTSYCGGGGALSLERALGDVAPDVTGAEIGRTDVLKLGRAGAVQGSANTNTLLSRPLGMTSGWKRAVFVAIGDTLVVTATYCLPSTA
jgi:hypothetical protein